ncbi:MAG: DUF1565 domain-containing protein [Leptolyngbyaceae bacterium]|nr:DUF1565 domain-containing protein [Leptolyngbyaceae bacterium]
MPTNLFRIPTRCQLVLLRSVLQWMPVPFAVSTLLLGLSITSTPKFTGIAQAVDAPVTATTLGLDAPSPTPGLEVVAQVPVNARFIYVNPILGSDTDGSGSEGQPYRTITHALEQAEGSTVIELASGSYTADTGEQFPLTVKPDIILRGDESNQGSTVLVIGGGTVISPTFARQNVTLVALEGSQIRGLTITNPYTRGTGVWVESANPELRNNTFTRSLRDGVFITGTGNPLIEDNVFRNNDGNGIAVAKDATGTIRDNVFEDTGFGIAISQNAAPLIEDNLIQNNVDGVVVSNNGRPQLRGNVIRGNQRDGVVAIANANPDLGNGESDGGNVITGNGRYAIYNATSSNIIFAVGNQVDERAIQGAVEFVARTIATGFADTRGHWAEDYISALAERDIIGGFPDGTYRPNDPVTRAQFAAIIAKAFTPAAERGAIAFTDVQTTFWGYQAIQTAYRGGFVAGYPDNSFRPELRIPRVQALVALANGLGLSAASTSSLTKYRDASQIPDWAALSIAAATERDLVVSYPDVTVLNPNVNATRADIAAFVYQALVSSGSADPISSGYIVDYP